MKNILRKELIAKRKNLSPSFVEEYSQKIIQKILQMPDFEKFKRIGIYYPIQNEVNLLRLFEGTKQICLPRVLGMDMDFFWVEDPKKDLHLGSFKVMEPNENLTKVDKNSMDVIFVPLVGINPKKYRIGYGKGFYDRYLKDFLGQKIGVCYPFQIVDEDFQEEFDVMLDDYISPGS